MPKLFSIFSLSVEIATSF